jgi:hypothetical protein
MTFAARLQSLFQNRVLKLPSQNMAVMPLFSPVDLPMIVALSPKLWWRTLQQLRVLRHHLDEKQWASLDVIYPRPLMTAYVYLVLRCAEYGGFLDRLLREPQRAIIAEVFMRYICTIDVRLDSSDDHQQWFGGYHRLIQNQELKAVGAELCDRIAQLNLPLATRREILRLIVGFRRSYIHDTLRWMQQPSWELTTIIRDKEHTAGRLWVVWSSILFRVYEVEGDLLTAATRCFFNVGMIIQVIDDLGDAPHDQRVAAHNLFIAFCRENMQEWVILKDHIDHNEEAFLNWKWARQNLPQSYARALALLDQYNDALLADHIQPVVTRALSSALERIRRLGG